jgi:hypothetical protein
VFIEEMKKRGRWGRRREGGEEGFRVWGADDGDLREGKRREQVEIGVVVGRHRQEASRTSRALSGG